MSWSIVHGRQLLSLFPAVLLISQLILSPPSWTIEQYPLLFTQVPADASLPEPMKGGFCLPPNTALDGSRIVLRTPGEKTEEIINLTGDFAAAVDPDVSFDGERFLFAGKKRATDPWDIWEMRIDGTELRRLTENLGDCREPVYTGILNTLNAPEWDQVLFVSNHHGTWNESGHGRSTSLYTCKIDGTEVHRITYNLSSDFGPFVLGDGRILYTSWQRVGNRFPPVGILPLMTVFSDGTDAMPFYGNHQPPILRHQAREAADRWVYFIETDGETWCGGGALARVSMKRPLHTRQVLADDGLYSYPCPLADGNLAVSWRQPGSDSSYGIYLFDSEQREGQKVVCDSADYHELDAQLVAPRTKPKGRSTVVTWDRDTSWFFCVDAYISDPPAGEKIHPGEIKRVRLIEGIPPKANSDQLMPTGLDGPDGVPVYDRRRLIADFPIESDGSISIQAPKLTPLHFQTVDQHGLSLQTCQTWLWLMPMERSGCIGCHEDREMTPPNRFVQAARRAPRDFNLPPRLRRTVDFCHDVMPLIEASCLGAKCHQPGGAHLDLSGGMEPVPIPGGKSAFNRAYVNLLTKTSTSGQRYVVPDYSGKSLLARKLLGLTSASSGMAETKQHPDPKVKQFDRLTFIEWIDFGARWNNSEEDPCSP